jgi:hypothetical protein
MPRGNEWAVFTAHVKRGSKCEGTSCPFPYAAKRWDLIVVTDKTRLVDLARVWRGTGHVAGSAATIALIAPDAADPRTRESIQYDLGQEPWPCSSPRPTSASEAATRRVAVQDLARHLLGLPTDRSALGSSRSATRWIARFLRRATRTGGRSTRWFTAIGGDRHDHVVAARIRRSPIGAAAATGERIPRRSGWYAGQPRCGGRDRRSPVSNASLVLSRTTVAHSQRPGPATGHGQRRTARFAAMTGCRSPTERLHTHADRGSLRDAQNCGRVRAEPGSVLRAGAAYPISIPLGHPLAVIARGRRDGLEPRLSPFFDAGHPLILVITIASVPQPAHRDSRPTPARVLKKFRK